MRLDVLVPVVLFTVVGLMLIAVSVPLVRGTVAPGTYGLRTGETLADPRVWHAANRYTGRDMMVLGSLLVVYAIAGVWWRPVSDMENYVAITTVALFFASIAIAIRGWLFAIRYARTIGERAS